VRCRTLIDWLDSSGSSAFRPRLPIVSRFKVSACIAEHVGDRADQQDRVAILTSKRNPGALLAIVADGMGGRTGGRMASDQVVATADSLFQELSEQDSGLRALLEQIATEAHTVIRLTAMSSEKEPHSTIVALIVKKDYAIWAHAGDSRLYFFRAGKLVHRTDDHTYAAKLIAEGKIDASEVSSHKYKNILVSALGISREPRLAVGEASDLRVGDAFLLCSDGVWAYFEDHELGSLLHGLAPREASEHLVRIARERAQGRGDNLSLAIVKLEAPAEKRHAPTATLWFDGAPSGPPAGRARKP
jgi:serine/threonine protein phosphatase PrpC